MPYIDGFVAAVPTANKDAFIEHARMSAKLFKKHGALSVVECWGDEVPDGELTSFPQAVQCKKDETVVFSWVTWPDKATREAGNEKVFADMSADDSQMTEMPFDGKRLIYGGFQQVI